MSYERDREWADAYIPALRQVVGPLLLEEAPLELDARQATDLIIFSARDLRIGCRVRSAGYAERYPWDFTIRSRRDSGAVTELTKIIDGWADWMVYAHAASESLPKLARWLVVDLDVFRSCLIRDAALRERTRHGETPNGDGTYFVPFDVRWFPSALIVAASHRIERELVVA